MLIRILSDCRAEDRHLSCGEVVDISENTARSLIAIGRAEHASVAVEDVATVDTAPAKPPAKRGRATDPQTTTTKPEED